MTKDYLETLGKVLIHLKSHPEAPETEVRDMSEPYWTEVRRYLKEKRVVVFSGGVKWYSVRTGVIDGCLEDIRIQKRLNAEEKKNEKSKERRNFRQQMKIAVVGAVFGSVVTIATQQVWAYLNSKESTDKDGNDSTEQSTYQGAEDSDDSHDSNSDSIKLN